MFIVWGTQSRQERLGMVADVCPYCRQLSAFTIVDHFRVSHLYYVPLGRGRHVQRSRQCGGCRQHFGFDPQRYAQPVSMPLAARMAADEMLYHTNPRLWARLEGLERSLQHACGDEGADERLRECARWVRWFATLGVETDAMLQSIGVWRSRTEDERDALLLEFRHAGDRAQAALRRRAS